MCNKAQTYKAKKLDQDSKWLCEVNKHVEVILMKEIQSKITKEGWNSDPSHELSTLKIFRN